jgi:hypothetical protein
VSGGISWSIATTVEQAAKPWIERSKGLGLDWLNLEPVVEASKATQAWMAWSSLRRSVRFFAQPRAKKRHTHTEKQRKREPREHRTRGEKTEK